MVRILHTADWQLGKEFGEFEPADAAMLSEARVAVVRRIAALAREHAVDLVTVGGDVFEHNAVREKTIRQAFSGTEGYPCPWVYIPGNHDPALSESVWSCARRIGAAPAHVHLCTAPTPLVLLEGRVAILPAPLTQRTTFHDSTEWFDTAATPDGALRIGLAHGSIEGVLPEGAGRNNPIARDRVDRARLDVLLLGDWHGFLQVDGRTVYSGTPETDRFRDNVSGHVALIELAPGEAPRITALPTGQYRWRSLEPLLAVPTDVDAAIAELDALRPDDVVLFRPSGQITLTDNRRLCDASDRAQGRVRALRVHTAALRVTPTDEDIDALQADGFVSRVIERLRAEQAESAEPEHAAVAREALVMLANLLDARGEDGAAACT